MSKNRPMAHCEFKTSATLLELGIRRQLGGWLGLAMLAAGACTPRSEPPVVTGPELPSDLRVVATTNSPTVFEGAEITLTSTVTGGTPPYLYRWDLNSGPIELELTEIQASTLNAGALSMPGRYVFRITVTDDAGFHATDYQAVEVSGAFEAEAPALAVIGEPVELTAELSDEAEGATLLWEVTSGTATIENPTAANAMLTTEEPETVDVRVTVTIPSEGGEPQRAIREFEVVSVADLSPRVVLETNFGNMTLELEGERSPLHTANFLLYVDDGFYDGLIFHRLVVNRNPLTGEETRFVLQGGGYEHVGDQFLLREPTRDPVLSEADNGLSNGVVNSVALALTGRDRNSGTTQFFFNLDTENSFLDNQGFTVFANLVDGELVLGLMVQVPRQESPIIESEESLPIVDLLINRARREN